MPYASLLCREAIGDDGEPPSAFGISPREAGGEGEGIGTVREAGGEGKLGIRCLCMRCIGRDSLEEGEVGPASSDSELEAAGVEGDVVDGDDGDGQLGLQDQRRGVGDDLGDAGGSE